MKLNSRWKPASPSGGRLSDIPALPAPHLAGELYEWMDQARAARMAEGSWHEYAINALWALDRIQRELVDCVVLTQSRDDRDEDDFASPWRRVFLELSPGCLVMVKRNFLQVFARDPRTARDVAEGLWVTFRQIAEPKPPVFHLVKKNSCGVESEEIPLQHGAIADETQLGLHYGSPFIHWNGRLLEALRVRPTGMVVLEGPPGTGKTSYIRHLMAVLKDSHRFYFVPSSSLEVLKDPEFVDFWSGERTLYPESQMVVVLEDAEEALLPRSHGNRAEVGVLLNISDGLLGDFLRLHIICTINCPVDRLDPALLRPGRLLARWHFGRLTRQEAEAVAASVGKALPEGGPDEFSLAEIFTGVREPDLISSRSMGFERQA
jgi:hypothetical protein